MARKKAEQSAKAAFVKWLGEAVVVCENAENETTLFLQGEESKDKDALSEAGKAVEKSSDTYKSVAAGLVRGLDASSHQLECRRQGILDRLRVEPRQRQVGQGHRHARSGDRREAVRSESGARSSGKDTRTRRNPQPEDDFSRGGRVPEVAVGR